MTTLGWRAISPFLVMAAGYWLLARASLFFVFPSNHVAALWLPNGAAAAWILLQGLRGRRPLPLLLTAMAANASANLMVGHAWSAAAVFALANGLEMAVFMAVLKRGTGGQLRMDHPRDLAHHALASLAGPIAGGLAGAAGLCTLWPGGISFNALWRDWTVLGSLGYLWMTPAVFCAMSRREKPDLRRLAEGAASTLLSAAAAAYAFQRPAGDDTQTYLVIPPLLWSVLRAGRPGALASTGLISAIAVAFTIRGQGPFAGDLSAGITERMVSLQGFLAVTILCALVLAAILKEMEQAKESLGAHRLRLEAMLGELPAVVWTVDPEFRITSSRGKLLSLLNLEQDQVNGTPLTRYFGTDDPNFPSIKAHREALEGRPSDYRQEWNGRTWQVHVEPLRGEGDRVTGAIGIAQDITVDLEAEEGRSLAKKMEALSRMAGRVAHDFNNSLTAILGFCELLLEDTAPGDEKREDLDAIHRAARRAADTAKQLTAFSPHKMNEARPLDLNALIQEYDAALGETLGPAVARVYRLEPGLPLVKLDPAQMRDVLRRLALNARTAMPEGGQLILATGRRGDGRVRLAVQDTGPGLSDEAKAHIFEPYFTTQPRGQGAAGLGLATCYGLVRQNGGTLTYHGTPGKGAAFHLEFPASGPAPAPAPAASALPEDAAPPRGHEVVLLAEDEESVRAAVARVLEGLGYTVLSAPDGARALALLDGPSGAAVKLLLSDVDMPGMTGVELARRVAEKRPDVRRLLMSGYAEASLLKDGTLPPRTSFLQKPFAFPALARRLRELLDAPSSSDLLK